MSKIVLVTGASSGLGLAVANFLQNKGYTVYGTSRSTNNDAFSFKMIPLEVTEIDSIETTIDSIISEEGRLDVLINNAGIGVTGSIEETPTEEMRKVFDVNLFGVIDLMKIVLPHMREQKSGLIINITSIAGYMGLPFRGVYSAAKGAIELISEATSMEVKSFGIDIVNLAPGDYATNIASSRYHTPVYEDSPYKKSYEENLELMNKHVNDGDNPEKLAHKVYQIIKSNNRNIHYKSGTIMQKASIVLKRLLPDRLYERLLMNYYKL